MKYEKSFHKRVFSSYNNNGEYKNHKNIWFRNWTQRRSANGEIVCSVYLGPQHNCWNGYEKCQHTAETDGGANKAISRMVLPIFPLIFCLLSFKQQYAAYALTIRKRSVRSNILLPVYLSTCDVLNTSPLCICEVYTHSMNERANETNGEEEECAGRLKCLCGSCVCITYKRCLLRRQKAKNECF